MTTTQRDDDVEIQEVEEYAPMCSEKYQNRQIKKAQQAGFEIVDDQPDIIQVDWDRTEFIPRLFKYRLHALFDSGIPIAQHRAGFPSFFSRISKSGNHHIYVRLAEPMDVYKRIALACVLGSDLKREELNLKRVAMKCTRPIVFFEKPE